MGKKTKKQILAADPESLSEADKKRLNNWLDKGEVSTFVPEPELAPAPPEEEPQEEPQEVPEEPVEENGEVNAPPLELTPEIKDYAEKKTADQDDELAKLRSQTKPIFSNGVNDWRLLSKIGNDFMAFQNVTMAMKVGKRGVIVCVKESINSQISLGVEYIPNAILAQGKDGKWTLT